MKLKEKLYLFLERITMSNHEYLTMKNDAQNFKNIMGCVGVNISTKYVDCRDKYGELLCKFPESIGATIDVNVTDMLKAMGVIYDKNLVRLNIIEGEKDGDNKD